MAGLSVGKAMSSQQAKPDMVNRPPHYTQGEIECIDAMKAQSTAEEFSGFLKLQTVKYLWRYRHKNGLEDLKKARWYLDRLILEAESAKGN